MEFNGQSVTPKEAGGDSEWSGTAMAMMFVACFAFMVYIMVQKNKERRKTKYEKEVSKALSEKLDGRGSMFGSSKKSKR